MIVFLGKCVSLLNTISLLRKRQHFGQVCEFATKQYSVAYVHASNTTLRLSKGNSRKFPLLSGDQDSNEHGIQLSSKHSTERTDRLDPDDDEHRPATKVMDEMLEWSTRAIVWTFILMIKWFWIGVKSSRLSLSAYPPVSRAP